MDTFRNRLIHGVLQITMQSIFRCILHQCSSQGMCSFTCSKIVFLASPLPFPFLSLPFLVILSVSFLSLSLPPIPSTPPLHSPFAPWFPSLLCPALKPKLTAKFPSLMHLKQHYAMRVRHRTLKNKKKLCVSFSFRGSAGGFTVGVYWQIWILRQIRAQKCIL